MEYNINTGDCFMSNEALATQFGVSGKTISRALENLESKGFIKRETKNVHNGKERHITINLSNIENYLNELPKDKLSLAEPIKILPKDKLSLPQRTNCPLAKGQNDPIKDKEKNKIIKDNLKNSSDCMKAKSKEDFMKMW